MPKDISRVVISGTADKASVFIAVGVQIRGMTKKGKEFFKLDTSHTETISQLHVEGMNLWSAGAYTLNCYASKNNSIADKYFFICEDVINDMVVTSLNPQAEVGSRESLVALACNDSTIKAISEDGKLMYQTVLDAAPITLSLVNNEDTAGKLASTIICYGLTNGNIGAIELGRDEAIVLWEVNCSADQRKAPVSIVQVATLKESLHLVVVRDDSTIEVHKFLERESTVGEAELVFTIKE